MAFAETQKLVVQLDLAGNFSSQMSASQKALGSFGRTAGSISKSAGALGGSFKNASNHLKGLITGPLGIIGLTGGLFSLGGILEGSLRHTSDFGLAIEKLTGLTGESAQSMGELLLVFEKYGLSAERTAQLVGFAEKTLGKLAETSAAAATGTVSLSKAQDDVRKAHEKLSVATLRLNELESKSKTTGSQLAAARFHVKDATVALTKAQAELAGSSNVTAAGQSKLAELDSQYGLHLVDTKGKVVDYTTELKQVADFYTSDAAASKKAALAAQLFGRGYADLIPILSLGSKGIADAEQAVTDLGLSLGTDTQGALSAYKSSLRQVGEAIGVLQIQIGLALIPTVTKLANGLSLFLEHGGTKQIAGFFKSAGEFAGNFADVLANSVIPTISGLASAANSFWGSIPKGLRDLLFNTVIADRTIKFLFGVSPVKTVVSFASDAISSGISKGLGTALAGTVLSKVFVQPVFVTNPGFGMGGGLPGAAVGAGEVAVGGAEALGASAGVIGIGALAALAAPFAALVGAAVLADIARNGHVTPIGSPHGQMSPKGSNTPTTPVELSGKTVDDLTNPLNPLDLRLGKIADDTAGVIVAIGQSGNKLLGPLNALHKAFVKDFAGLRHATKPLDIAAFARKVGAEIAKGVGSLKTTNNVLASLKAQLARTHDPKLEAVLHAAIAKVERRLPGREAAAKANTTLAGMLKDGKLSKAELSKIKTVEQALKDRGLPHAASVIAKKVDDAKKAQAAATAKTTAAVNADIQAIKDKDLSVAVTIPQTISIRDIAGQATVYSRYSTQRTA